MLIAIECQTCKTEHKHHDHWECDVCGHIFGYSKPADIKDYNKVYKYCPYCGTCLYDLLFKEAKDD